GREAGLGGVAARRRRWTVAVAGPLRAGPVARTVAHPGREIAGARARHRLPEAGRARRRGVPGLDRRGGRRAAAARDADRTAALSVRWRQRSSSNTTLTDSMYSTSGCT